MPRASLLLVGAVLLRFLGLPGFWEPLAPALTAVAILLRGMAWERGTSLRAELLAGIAFYGLLSSWLIHTTWIAPPIIGLILFWVWPLQAFLYRRLRRRLPPLWAFPLALVSTEWLMNYIPLGGFPWGSPALAFAQFPPIRALASVIGEWGVAYAIALAVALLLPPRPRPAMRLACLILATASLAGYLAPSPEPTGDAPTFVAVQPSLGLDEKVNAEDVQRRNLAESFPHGDGPDLLLWAETMFGYPVIADESTGYIRTWTSGSDLLLDAAEYLKVFHQRRDGADDDRLPGRWLYRVLERLPPDAVFLSGAYYYGTGSAQDLSPRTNRVVAWDGSGRQLGSYAKQCLVPGGEWLPMRSLLPGDGIWLARWIFDNFYLTPTQTPGSGLGPLAGPLALREGSLKLGIAICFENAYPRVFSAQADRGAQAFAVFSNEVWFLRPEREQMMAMTAFRAAETGRSILRVTNTGRTALFSPTGAVLEALPDGLPGALQGALPTVPSGARTPYLAFGRYLGIGLTLLTALFAIARCRQDGESRC